LYCSRKNGEFQQRIADQAKKPLDRGELEREGGITTFVEKRAFLNRRRKNKAASTFDPQELPFFDLI